MPDTHAIAHEHTTAQQTGSRLRRWVMVFVASIMLVAWTTTWLGLRALHQHALDAEVRSNANLARTLEEQTIRVLSTVDNASWRMRNAVAAKYPKVGLAEALSESDFIRFANETGLAPEILTQLSLIDAHGRFVGSNLDPRAEKTGQVDLSAREHVRVHLAPQEVPQASQRINQSGLFIGAPVLGKVSGQWTVQVSRKLTAPNGTTLGVVVASLNPKYFERVYAGVQLGEKGVITLIGDDNIVRAQVVGGRWNSATGDLRDGKGLIQASAKVADYPLKVLVATDTDWALAHWNESRNITVALTTLLSLVAVTAAFLFMRGIRRMENGSLELMQARAKTVKEKALKEAARYQANTDFLTGVANRRAFFDLAGREAALSLEQGSPLALLLIDIDHFKHINDTHGHDIGDVVLQHVANRFKSALRDMDVFGRIGGEEFAALLLNTPKQQAQMVAERLRAQLADASIPTPSGQLIEVTASIGLVTSDSPQGALEALLHQADRALYQAKRAGRNRVQMTAYVHHLVPDAGEDLIAQDVPPIRA